MAFDLWILSLIGCAVGMFLISLVQDLAAVLRRRRELAALPPAVIVPSAVIVPMPKREPAPLRARAAHAAPHEALA